MSVEMKLGRWITKGGSIEEVHRERVGLWRWCSKDGSKRWSDEGVLRGAGADNDLIRYLGPLELSPTPACADQAGTPVVSTVSTETAGEQLRRMRERYNAMDREASIYSGLLAALDQAKSDLGELIRAMEKENDL